MHAEDQAVLTDPLASPNATSYSCYDCSEQLYSYWNQDDDTLQGDEIAVEMPSNRYSDNKNVSRLVPPNDSYHHQSPPNIIILDENVPTAEPPLM